MFDGAQSNLVRLRQLTREADARTKQITILGACVGCAVEQVLRIHYESKW